ncbi:MAG: helix-turn-helix transcriptional regulator [Kiloniellales bacterium]|nr:helix-turn-helix transcriptional regulator [Kiloniellales bacterium]
MTEPTILRDSKGRPTHVVMPVGDYERLRQQAEAARVEELRGRDFLPADVADQILEGERPLKVLRTWRGLSQSQLAERAGLPQPTIALLERGRRKGTLAQWRAIAQALGLQLETVTGWD